MKIKNVLMISAIMILAISCSSNGGLNLNPEANKKTITKAPEWFMQLPTKDGMRYQSATSTSRDMQIAIDKAALTAANKLSGQIESEMNAVVKRVQEETGLEENSSILDQFTKTQEQIISNSLKDYAESKKEVHEEKTDGGRIYRAYVLVEWNEHSATQKLLDQIKQDQALYDAIRATELFDEMEAKVDAYRDRKTQ